MMVEVACADYCDPELCPRKHLSPALSSTQCSSLHVEEGGRGTRQYIER